MFSNATTCTDPPWTSSSAKNSSITRRRQKPIEFARAQGPFMLDVRLRLGVTAALGAGLLLLSSQQSASNPAPTPSPPSFEDVTAASGINFKHYDISTPTQYILARIGSVLGWIDYDND